jgi:hypothetical protein
MDLREMIIDEMEDRLGVNAISIVDNPAIESDFVTLQSDFKQKVELAEVDKEKRILLGAALIPNKPIFRADDGKGYYIYFKPETVRKTMELFMRRGLLDNTTENHDKKIKGLHIVESWIVEDTEKDKSAVYGLNLEKGTWCVSYKCDNQEIYEKAKAGKLKGFSIEGHYSSQNKTQLSLDENKLKQFSELHELAEEAGLSESYNDYPRRARENAKRAVKYAEKNGWGDCGTQTGKTRAHQLANGENISADTVQRMASFNRHRQHKDVAYDEGCGGLMWDAWGGTEGVEWAIRKINES